MYDLLIYLLYCFVCFFPIISFFVLDFIFNKIIDYKGD